MAVGRPTKALNVTPEEKEKLTMLARRPKSGQALARTGTRTRGQHSSAWIVAGADLIGLAHMHFFQGRPLEVSAVAAEALALGRNDDDVSPRLKAITTGRSCSIPSRSKCCGAPVIIGVWGLC